MCILCRFWVWIVLLLVGVAVGVVACGEMAKLPFEAGVGPNPTLPPPNKTLLPTMKVAPAKGWPEDRMPKPPGGMAVSDFAKDLKHPRWLYVLPNGDVLVAETSAPPRPDEYKGFRG